MPKTQSRKAKIRFERESLQLCEACHGTGQVLSATALARAKRGGNASYLASLGKGQLSMSERGQRGGRPKELSLEDLQTESS